MMVDPEEHLRFIIFCFAGAVLAFLLAFGIRFGWDWAFLLLAGFLGVIGWRLVWELRRKRDDEN